MTDEPDGIARLLAAPMSGFVEERKRLAAALKSVGRRDEAQAIAKLAKPSVAVWVVNQLAHAEIPSLKRLGEVSTAMRTAPRRPRDGGDAGSDYARLLGEHRDLLRSLRAAAEKVLTAAKLGASPAVLERIVQTLRAGMADEETRGRIEAGRLLRDVAEPDFASLVGAVGGDDHAAADADGITGTEGSSASAASASPPGRPGGREEAARARQLAAQAAAQERARAHEAAAAARERARERADAEREVARLRTKADAARKQVASEERTVASLRQSLTDEEQRLAHARQEADAIDRSLATAEEKARSLSD